MKTGAKKEEFGSSPVSLFNLICQIEQQFPVNSLESVDGTKIWNLLRVLIYFYFQKKTNIKKKNFFLKKMIYMLWESIKPLHLPKKQIEFCGFSGTESRKLVGNFFYDIYMDPLYEILGDDYYVFEWTTPSGYRRNYEKNIYSKNYVPMHIPLFSKASFRLLLYKVIKKSLYRLKSDNCLKEIISFVCCRTSLSDKEFSKYIYDSLEVFFVLKEFFYHILKKMCPKIIFLRCGYGRFHMALSQACRELNIPSIELQHGIITKYHVGYVKHTFSDNRDCVPDYILTYGDVFTKIIKGGSLFDSKKVISIGFPYIDRVKKYPPQVSRDLLNFISKFSIILLVTSQWIVAKEIKNFYQKLLKFQNHDLKIGIIFKPHPRDWRDYSDIKKYNNVFLADKYGDIYEFLKIIDIHSTVSSTSGIEALVYGKPNIYVDVGTSVQDIFDVIDEKSSFLVNSSHQFMEKLKYIISNYESVSKEAEKKSILYFKPNALKNMKKFLDSRILRN